jgi:hypothetical protein
MCEHLKVHVTGAMHYSAQGTCQSQQLTYRQTYYMDSTVDLSTQPPVYVPKQPK